MKPTRQRPAFLVFMYRALIVFAVCLALVVAVGTLYVLVLKDGQVSAGTVSAGNVAISGADSGAGSEGQSVFTGIGRMRIPVASGEGGGNVVVVLSVSFPYRKSDRPFSEELAARVGEFRNITKDYFTNADVTELRTQNEDELKSKLLAKFNAVIRLGKIETLYFDDFLIIE